MGFLLGAFGKLSAGRRKREIQSRLMRVQSRLRRATRHVGDMDKRLQRDEKRMLNQLNAQGMITRQQAYGMLDSAKELQNYQGLTANGGTMTSEQTNAYNVALSKFNADKLSVDTQYEGWISQQKQQMLQQNIKTNQLVLFIIISIIILFMILWKVY